MKNTAMKKMLALLCVSAMLCTVLCGCGAKKEEPAAPAAPVSAPDPAPAAAMPNPMTEITAEEFAVPVNVPAEAKDVKYFTLNDGSDNLVYEMQFTAAEHNYVFRAQPTGVLEAYDMSGLNYDNWDTAAAEIAYCTGTVMTNSNAAAVYWLDIVPGINYTLGCSEAVSADDITAMANTVFMSAQGDADGDEPANIEAYRIPLKAPEYAENENFYYDENMSVMEFDYSGAHFVYCAQYTSELKAYDMSGIFADEWRSGTFSLGHCELFAKDNDNCNVLYWLDIVPGVNYTLSCDYDFAIEIMLDLVNEIFEPLQGEVDGDADYSCEYSDGAGSRVSLVRTEDGSYNVEIGIYRLTTFEGKGTEVDGNIEFEVEGPGEGAVTGIFFCAEDGTWTVDFVHSDWGLLESGTVFTGFTLN